MPAKSKIDIKTVDAPVTDLQVAPFNPRSITPAAFEQLKKAMLADPEMLQARPVIALPSGVVVAGNMRLKAAQALGWKTIPTIYADLDDKRAREWMLRDNNGFGEWVEDDLGTLLAELKAAGSAIDLLGFESAELDRLLGSVTQVPEEDEADLTPPAEPITKPGDLWLLGNHRLLCGDSTNITDVERLMAGRKAALLWTDPPYGVEYVGKTAEALTIENDGAAELPTLLRGAFTNADIVMQPGAVYYIAHPDAFAYEFIGATRDAGWVNARPAVVHWIKDSIVMGRGDYHARSEPMLYGWKPGAAHHFVADRTQDNLWEIARPKRSTEHPTMKPPELIARAITNSSDRGDLVLDLFGGSGSTLIAAEQTDRTAYLMEIDAGYADVIVRRWQALTGKTAVLDNTNGLSAAQNGAIPSRGGRNGTPYQVQPNDC